MHVEGMNYNAGQGICLPHCPPGLPRDPAGRVAQHGLWKVGCPPTYRPTAPKVSGLLVPLGHMLLWFVTHPDQTGAGWNPSPSLTLCTR